MCGVYGNVNRFATQTAFKLWPANGKAASQLALMALKRNLLVDAVLYYGRALLVAQPILTARDSLTSLFERIRQRLAKEPPTALSDLLAASGLGSLAAQPSLASSVKEATPVPSVGGDIWLSPFVDLPHTLASVLLDSQLPVVPPMAPVTAETEPAVGDKETATKLLQAFELRFLALHGLLYTGVGLEQFPGLCTQAISLLTPLLQQRACSATRLLRLLLVNLFAISDREAASKGAPSATLTAAVDLTCGFIEAILQLPLSLGDLDAPGLASVAKFMDWLVLHYPRLCSLGELGPSWVAMFESLSSYMAALLEAIYSHNWVDVLPDADHHSTGDPYPLSLATIALTHSIAPLWEDVTVRGFEPLSATSGWHDRLHAGTLRAEAIDVSELVQQSTEVVLHGHLRVARILGAAVELSISPSVPFVLSFLPSTQKWTVQAREVATVAAEAETDETLTRTTLDVASMTRADIVEQFVQLLDSDDLGLAPVRLSKVAEYLAEQPVSAVRECLESTSARFAATTSVCRAIIGGLKVCVEDLVFKWIINFGLFCRTNLKLRRVLQRRHPKRAWRHYWYSCVNMLLDLSCFQFVTLCAYRLNENC